MPESARKFENGDVCLKRDEYVKGEPMFGYYNKTDAGYNLERTFWKGAHATRYNWVKNQPDFKAKTEAKPKPKAKKKVAKAKPKAKKTESDIMAPKKAAKKKPAKKKAPAEPKPPVVEKNNLYDMFRSKK